MAVKKTPYQRTQPERIILLTGAIGAAVLITVGLTFYPNGWEGLPGWVAGFLWGYTAICLSGFIYGAIQSFRHHTPKLMADNRVWEISFANMYTLDSVYYPIDKKRLMEDPSLTPEQKAEIEREALTVPGANEYGEAITIKVLPLGGYRWLQFYSLPGEDGYILFFGEQWIRFFDNVCVPRTLELVDHSQINEKMLARLAQVTRGKFKPYVTPLYICGDIDPDFATHVRKNPEIRMLVLEALKIPGLARAFAKYLSRQPGFEDIKINPSKVADELRTWLERKNIYAEAIVTGYASPKFWRNTALGLQGELTRVNQELHEMKNIAQWYRRAMNGEAQRKAGVYGGAFSNQRTPPPPIMEDRERIPGTNEIAPWDV